MKKTLLISALALMLLAGCSYQLKQVSDTYLPVEPNRPMKISYRISGQACEKYLFFAFPLGDDGDRIGKAIAEMTRNNEQIDNVVGLHVETSTSYWVVGETRCTVVSGYPVLYADSQPKRRLFARDMVEGPFAVGDPQAAAQPVQAAAAAAPAATAQSQVAAQPVQQVQMAPQQPVGPPMPTEQSCKKSCSRFSGLWKGQASIRGTIEKNCVNRCLSPASIAYRDCVDRANKVDDIARCNAL